MGVVPIITKEYDASTFWYAAALLRNDVCTDRLIEAQHVAVFKSRLETYLFNSYISSVVQPHFFKFCHCIYIYHYILYFVF